MNAQGQRHSIEYDMTDQNVRSATFNGQCGYAQEQLPPGVAAPPVALQCDRLNDVLDDFTKAIEGLEKRLAPILGSPLVDAIAIGKQAEPEICLSPLAEAIRLKVQKAQRLNNTVRAISARIEV